MIKIDIAEIGNLNKAIGMFHRGVMNSGVFGFWRKERYNIKNNKNVKRNKRLRKERTLHAIIKRAESRKAY